MKVAILRAVAVAVVHSREFHPNLELLLKHLFFRLRLDPATVPDLDDEAFFLRSCLPSLPLLDAFTVLTFFAFALTLDGQLAASQTIYFKRAQAVCHLQPSASGLVAMARKLNSLTLQPTDVAFSLYAARDRVGDDAGEETRMERLEAAVGAALKMISF